MAIPKTLQTIHTKSKNTLAKLPWQRIKRFIPKNPKARIAIVLILVGFVGYQGIKAFLDYRAAQPEIITNEVQVSQGDIIISFGADGQAELDTVNLDFEVSGKLKELYVAEGDSIEAGKALAALDDSTYLRLFQTATINYEKAQANLRSTAQSSKLSLLSEEQKLLELKNSYEALETEYSAMAQIPKAYAKQELENKRREYENTKASYQGQKERYNILSRSDTEVASARANLENARIDLATAQDNLSKTRLTAPVKARVLNISYAPGEAISENTTSDKQTADTSHFMVITGTDKVQVLAPISETDLTNIAVGMAAEVEFEAFAGRTFKGTVVSIKALPLIDANKLVTYDVKVELEEGQDEIRSGMTCSIEFLLREKRNVLVIPNKAVSFENDQQVVRVKTANGKTETRAIETGLTDGKQVEVISGLTQGETIVYTETQKKTEVTP